MSSRGVVWITWGEKQPELLARSIHSVQQTNPDLGLCLITSCPETNMESWFGLGLKVIRRDLEPRDCRCRAGALLDSPFETTLHLDTDTVVLRDVSYGFHVAEKFGIALTIAPASDVQRWHKKTCLTEDVVQYQAGVIFYSKSTVMSRRIIHRWDLCNTEEDLSRFDRQDQPGLAYAVACRDRTPYVLPRTWNFRPEFYRDGFGPIRVWHSKQDVPEWARNTPDQPWTVEAPSPCATA